MESNLPGLSFYEGLLGPLERLLIKMERRGTLIDPVYFKKQAKVAEARAMELEVELAGWSIAKKQGIVNWRSSQQTIEFLHGVLKLPKSPVWGKGKVKPDEIKIDAKALQWLRDYSKKKSLDHTPYLDLLIELKRCYSSIKYLNKLPLHADSNNYLHCTMAPDTATFRLAARTPELQQIPTKPEKDPYSIRTGFIAPPGMSYIVADQSQLEMRIQAHLLAKMFGDRTMIDDIMESDCHGKNALRIYSKVYPDRMVACVGKGGSIEGARMVPLADLPAAYVKGHPDPFVSNLRDTIKNIAYGLIYGMTKYSLGAHLKDETGEPIGDERAEQLLFAYIALYPGLQKFFDWAADKVKKLGGMYDLVGGFRPIPEGKDSRNWVVMGPGARKAKNTPMQRGAANIMSLIMLKIEDNIKLQKLGFSQRLQIHDEIDGYAPIENVEEVEAEIKYEMENAFELMCPLECEPGHGINWHEAK